MNAIAPQDFSPQAHVEPSAASRGPQAVVLPRAIASIMMANEPEVMQHLDGADLEAYVQAMRPRYAVRQVAALRRFAAANGLALAPLEAGLRATLPHVTALVNAAPEPRVSSIPAPEPSCARAVARGTLPNLEDLGPGWPILQGTGLVMPWEGRRPAPAWRRPLLQLRRMFVPRPEPMRAIDPGQAELARAAQRALMLLDPHLARAFAETKDRSSLCSEMTLAAERDLIRTQRLHRMLEAAILIGASASLVWVATASRRAEMFSVWWLAALSCQGIYQLAMFTLAVRPRHRRVQQNQIEMLLVATQGALYMAPNSPRAPSFFATQAERWRQPERGGTMYSAQPQLIDLIPELGDQLRDLFGEPDLRPAAFVEDVQEAANFVAQMMQLLREGQVPQASGQGVQAEADPI
jgi:hypothetical protein